MTKHFAALVAESSRVGSGQLAVGRAECQACALPTAPLRTAELVLLRAGLPQRLDDLVGTLGDGGEVDDRDDVFLADRAAVDLLEEVDRLVDAAELGIVVLDVPRR